MKNLMFGILRTPVARKLRLAALVFAILFSLSAIAQYLFIRNQINETAQSEFKDWAREIKEELGYKTKWDMLRFRQADWGAPTSYIFTKKGLLLDITGFIPDLISQVTLPDGMIYGKPIDITSEVGETWRILGKKIKGGIIVLGVAQSSHLADVDDTLKKNEKKFGTSIDEAIEVATRDIDQNIHYSVVDDFGNLKSAIGGIPLQTNSSLAKVTSEHTAHQTLDHKQYSVFSNPILDITGNVVGTIVIPKDVTVEQQMLHNAVSFNIVLAFLSWLVLGAFTTLYFLKYEMIRRMHNITLDEALKQEESDTLEFKSSVRWDYNQKKVNRVLEEVIVKTVVAFLNTIGGVLVIGVDDDKSIKGLQFDYDSLSKKNQDGLRLHLQQIISQRIGVDRYQSNISLEFQAKNGKDICVMRIKQAPKPVVIKEQNVPILYIRAGNATMVLDVEQALRYAQEHWVGARYI